MKIAPTIAGSSLTFALVVLRDIFVYLKHKRRRVKDLIEDFNDLTSKVDNILSIWNDINYDIDFLSTSFQRNNHWRSFERDVLRMQRNFKSLAHQYKSLSGKLEARNILTLGLTQPQLFIGTSMVESDMFEGATSECHTNIGPMEEIRFNKRESGDQTINNINMKDGHKIDIVEQKLWSRKFFKLARLDKDVIKLMARVDAMSKELVLKNFTSQMKPRVVEKMNSEELGDFISSHQKCLNELMQCLDNKMCKIIGIYGAPGVGTTNILKNLNNCLDASSSLKCNVEYVIWIDAGSPVQDRIIENCQEEIIERLKLSSGKTRKENANIISLALSKKNYILLIDDYHLLVKLEDIGIHEEHKYGKVVLVAKSLSALRNVKINKKIKIPSLGLKEASIFFKHFIVDYDGLSSEHKEMICPILKSLGGLPGLIKLTAKYLNDNRGLQHWKGIKDRSQLEIGIPKLLGLGALFELYKREYENLNGDELKKCLLYAALFPIHYKILKNILVECWKAEDFFDCHSTTLDAARAQGMIIFTELESSCLLESCNEEFVKLSAFFRKVAFHMPFPKEGDKTLFSYSISKEDRHLEEKDWNNARRVSLIQNDIKFLPSSPKCYDLSTLFMQFNRDLIEIKNDFFMNMSNLRVLDLNNTGIKLLPDSISMSKSLRNLYLGGCDSLTKLPTTIIQLTKLEILDIRGTSIPCLPREIWRLVSLRSLQISFTLKDCNKVSKSKSWNIFKLGEVLHNQTWLVFPPDMYKILPHLEELTIDFEKGIGNEIGEMIKDEVDQFQIGNKFKHNLSPGLSLFSLPSHEEAQGPSYLSERLATRNFQSSSQQHDDIERSHITLDDKKENKGKAVAEPTITMKASAKPVDRQGGIRIKEPSDAEIEVLAGSDDEGDELQRGETFWKNKYQKLKAILDNQLLQNEPNTGYSKLDRSVGEGTSESSGGGH